MSPTSEFQSRLTHGHRHFAAGRYRDAHEAWEVGWLASQGAEKQVLQVLVLWATAFHHAKNDNRTGAINLMRRALERLAAPPITRAPLDTEVLRDALVESWERLGTQGALDLTPPGWDPTVLEEEVPDEVDLTHRTRCPYCGEPVAVEVDAALAKGAEYVEDCPVCCRPWTVCVRADGGQIAIELKRDDD